MSSEFGQHHAEIDAAATGRRIQEIRKQKKLKVTDISDYIGFYEPQAVYKWLRGESLPTLQNMFLLSRLFETTIDDIIRSTGQEGRKRGNQNDIDERQGDDNRSSPFQYISGMFLNRRFIFFRMIFMYHSFNQDGTIRIAETGDGYESVEPKY